ncbi:Uncharacterised protein [Streptococcus pneumoniae]|nr:Uncharacterised protein [Streptococcus pneumoniae]
MMMENLQDMVQPLNYRVETLMIRITLFQLIGIKIILYGWLTIILSEKYIMDQII